jgi:hypothetical protein
MNTFQVILNRVTRNTDSPPRAAEQVAQGLLVRRRVIPTPRFSAPTPRSRA